MSEPSAEDVYEELERCFREGYLIPHPDDAEKPTAETRIIGATEKGRAYLASFGDDDATSV